MLRKSHNEVEMLWNSTLIWANYPKLHDLEVHLVEYFKLAVEINDNDQLTLAKCIKSHQNKKQSWKQIAQR